MLAPKPVPTNDKGFAALKDAIIARTGHHYYVDKDYLLRDRLDRRLAATGCASLADYLALLGQPKRGALEWQELEAEITIGETFFFRHQEQFAALRDVIFPDLIRTNTHRRALRIWSAGCAVGAEPYSIAILLERLLGAALRDWTIEILGSDISARALDQARAGVFTDWALRGMPAAERARDFTAMPDRRHWRIADRHRLRLRFVQHNLLSLPAEGGSADWAGFDLILCRNVLIYFAPARIAPTLSALSHCLSPTGWLMVGHSDAIAALPRHLRVVELAGTMAFRRPDRSEAAPPRFPWQPNLLRPAEASGPGSEVRRLPIPPLPPAEVSAFQPEPGRRTAPPLAVIRALADAGRLTEAAVACRLAIEAAPLDARLHLYDGIIAQAGGDGAAAEAALRRAVYLAGDLTMAHYHLGLLLLDGPAPEAGRRSMAQVIRLCAALPQDAVLLESDGLTPRELVEQVRLRLRAWRG
ncbi:protein-glutamate O-methyltransferase CheR [Acidisoma cellulosilytica]|uniref:protein-glutamate O-methyltransferase n=1 Tax=Acidisoma cellulosilyticum TaxID=2802395 RepID=A0A963YZD9_9PROT|nr:protein-glutamate O-methyltransferase CheR [Acidisoma cellulosilyticum]MCB8879958.1 protein-glutamate O-methyltransferase CheR [Acidisoma cellulosilyticum]